jgi:hypothetical protein
MNRDTFVFTTDLEHDDAIAFEHAVALRGSHTDRVLHRAHRPVLSVGI